MNLIRSAFLVLLLTCGPVLAQTGTGLTAKYYDEPTFASSALVTTRTDATIDFNWGTGIPSGTALTSGDTFGVAWSGQIEPEFSELYTFYLTADDSARLWVNDECIVLRSFYQGGGEMRGQIRLKGGHKVNIRIEYLENSGNTKAKLEWASASQPRQVVPTARLYPTTEIPNGGAVMREVWTGLSGLGLGPMTSNANYPNKPASREFITSFECLAQNWEDNFGTRVTGFIRAPVSGTYTFAVSGDDVVELYLSTDSNPANKALIASSTTWTAFRDFTASPSQQSAPRTLVAGQRYYVELLHKEEIGNDHWSVAWKQPGETAFSIIPGTALMQPGVDTAQPSTANFFKTLCTEQPRLGVSRERFLWLKQMWESPNPSSAKTRAQSIINSANNDLNAAPDSGRHGRDRLQRLAVAWWLTGDTRYPEYAWTNIINHAITNGDWADPWKGVTNGVVAIGYDWFFPYWSQARRTTMTNKMVSGFNGGWTDSYKNNIGVLINCGHLEAMLAVGLVNEAAAEGKIGSAIGRLNSKVDKWNANAGAWYEGTDYGIFTKWGFGQAMPAMEMSLGSTFGLSRIVGISATAKEPLTIASNTRQRFTFSDVGTGSHAATGWANWFARRYNAPETYDYSRQIGQSALNALFLPETTLSPTSTGMNPDKAFRGPADASGGDFCEVVTMRQNWTDSKATFVGGMGGTFESHGHLQSGTFQLSARGVKWFIDLSSEDYGVANHNTTTPNANGVDRWDYYRWRAEGHNCLVINPTAGPDRIWNAPPAPLIHYQSAQNGQRSFAVWDLSSNISGVTKVQRGIQLLNGRKEVLLQDEIVTPSASTAWWYAHFQNTSTPPAISGDGSSVVLTSGTERLWGKIVSGSGVWTVRPASALIQTNNPPVADTPNTGKSKLAIQLTGVTNTTLAVWFVPLAPGENPPLTPPTITPLNTWNLTAQNEAPVAQSSGASGTGGAPVDVNLRLLAKDDWTPVEQLTFAVGGAVGGTIALQPDGFTARFTPTPAFVGPQSFIFTASDTDGAASSAATIFISATPVVTNWTSTTSGNWSTGTNWQGGTAPVSSPGADIQFFNGQTLAAATITATNDLAGTTNANKLTFAGTGTSTTVVNVDGNPIRLVANGSTAPGITLSGITTGFRYNIGNAVTLEDDVTINANNSGTFVLSGAITGSGGMTRTGTFGTLILSGNNTYSGPTTISAGTLQIGNDGTTGTLGSGPVSIAGGATLRIDRTGTLDVPNDISGAGGLAINGTVMNDVVTLGGNNTFTGGVSVGAGSLRVTDAAQLGDGTKTIVVSGNSAVLRLDGSAGSVELPASFNLSTSNPNGAIIHEAGDNRIGGNITLTSGAGNTRFTSLAGTLTIDGNVAPNVTGRSLDLRGAGNGILNGGVLDGSTTNTLTSLTKNEAGTWTLNGSNAFTGPVTVSAGRLAINGTHNSGAITVASAATLAGRGTLGAATTVNGTLAPGDRFGAITFASTLALSATAKVQWELGGNTLAAADAVNAGSVTVTAGAKIDVVLNAPGSTANFLHSFWRSARTFLVIAGTSLSGAFSLGTVTADAGGRPVSTYGNFALQHTATGVNLVWTPIPGFPLIDDPTVMLLSPSASPASIIDETHALRVAISANGSGGTVSGFTWTTVSGPDAVASFANASAADTVVTFPEPGTYVLRGTAFNQVGNGSLDIVVEVAPEPVTTAVQHGVNGVSAPATFIRSDTTTWNSGARDQVLVGRNGSNAIFRSLLSFPMPAELNGRMIAGASLDLTLAAAGSGTALGPLDLHRLDTPFAEGTGDGITSTNGSGTGADWLRRTYTPSTAWASPGGGAGTDYAAAPLSSLDGFDPTGTDIGAAFTFDTSANFTAAVANAVSTAQPLNLLVKASDDATTYTQFVRFGSNDHGTAEYRPKLTISYHDHLAPVIDPGTAPAATVGSPVQLAGSITHGNGLGWSHVDGPGQVFISGPTSSGATVVFTRPGTHLLRLSAGNAHGETSRTLEIVATGTALTEEQIWRQTHFGTIQDSGTAAKDFDANGDGESNLLEFATAQSPHAATRATTALTTSGNGFLFHYTRNKAAMNEGYLFTVEWSDTLAAPWTAVVSDPPVSLDATRESVHTTIPAGVGSHRFIRLKIAAP